MRYSRHPKQHRHPHFPDGIADAEGNEGCRLCPLPKSNRIHRVTADEAAAADIERRRLGERDTPVPPTLF